MKADFEFKEIQVECYSGFKANERPVAFTYQGGRLAILEVTDRWYEGGLDSGRAVVDYFRVKTADGRTWLLRYQAETDSWLLCL